MPLVKKNSFGKISISDKVMVSGIISAIERAGLSGDIWLATKRGKPLAEDKFLSNAEMRSAVSAGFDENGDVRISFCAIVRFGVSINGTVGSLCDVIADMVRYRTGSVPSSIKVTVTGIKSSRIVRRNMELEMNYGPED